MSQRESYGVMTADTVGIVMKEAVRRALNEIRRQQFTFEAHAKVAYDGVSEDVVTSADKAAQEIYLRTIRQCFPNYGIVGEEDELRIEPKNGEKAYFTIDPLDGTRAFKRRQSHGVGSMIGLVDVDEASNRYVAAAYVGDVNTEEIFGYRPGSDTVHRISQYTKSQHLGEMPYPSLETQYIQLRDPERKLSSVAQRLVGRFKDVTVDGGSIGTWLARLWKQEVGAALLGPGFQTPWDLVPIVGITEKLGYVFLRIKADGGGLEVFHPELSMEKYKTDHEIIIVHGTRLDEILSW